MAKTSEIVYIHSPGSYPSGGLTGLASESSGGLDLPEDNGMRTMSTLAGIIACSAVVGGISAQEQTGSMKFKAIKNFKAGVSSDEIDVTPEKEEVSDGTQGAIYYQLGDEEHAGLRRFHIEAAELALADPQIEPIFIPNADSERNS